MAHFETVCGVQTVDSILDQVLALTSIGDQGDVGWICLPVNYVGLNYYTLSHKDRVSRMINYFVCPITEKKIIIISGAVHLYDLVTQTGVQCEEELATVNNFQDKPTHKMVFSAHCKSNRLKRRLTAANRLLMTLNTSFQTRVSGFNISKTFTCDICEGEHPSIWDYVENCRNPECTAFVKPLQPYPLGYIMIHEEVDVNGILSVFGEDKCNQLSEKEFVQLSARLIASIDHF